MDTPSATPSINPFATGASEVMKPSQEAEPCGLSPVAALTQGFDIEELDSSEKRPAGDISQNEQQSSGYVETRHRLAFRIGEIGLMINHEDGSELTKIPFLHHLPNSPYWLLGVVNLHGRLLPVFDLLSYLNMERVENSKEHMLLILGHDNDAAGFLIDGLPTRLSWTDTQQSTTDLTHKMLIPHIKTTCVIDKEIWLDLDTASLLEALEQSLSDM